MTATLGVEPRERQIYPPPLAIVPVLLIAAATTVLLLAVSWRYGYFGDELYFVAAGQHLSWGYVDQPPLVPLIARLMDTLAPGSLVALRIPAVLATATGTVVSALIARDLGGDRRSQVFAAACYGLAFATMSTTLSTPVFDTLLWTMLSWLIVRWVRTHSEGAQDDRLLLLAGVVVAVAAQVKFQILVFAAALLLTSLVLGPRTLLRRPMLWAGIALALVTTTPTLIWQATNGWPQLELSALVTAETTLGPLFNILGMFMGVGSAGLVLSIFGWWRLFRVPELRAYRFLGATALLVIAFFVFAGGRAHYVFGVFPVLWAVGAVGFQRRRERTGGRWKWMAWPAFALSLLAPINGLPVKPVESFVGEPYRVANLRYLGQIGWPEMADTVNEVYRSLPPEQRRTTTILTNDYWQASALEYYGPERGLPDTYSGSRGFWYFGQPPAQATTVLYVGEPTDALKKNFGDIRRVATIDNGMNIETQLQGAPVLIATDRRAPWAEIWPEFRRITRAE